MKRIHAIADIEELKAKSNIPLSYVSAIESQFRDWFEAEGTGESLTTFRLPNESCIYHLEDEQDASFLADKVVSIEYIEKESINDCTYYRVGVMDNHQMNLVYFLEGTLGAKYEQ